MSVETRPGSQGTGDGPPDPLGLRVPKLPEPRSLREPGIGSRPVDGPVKDMPMPDVRTSGLVRRELVLSALRFAVLSSLTTSAGIGTFVGLVNSEASADAVDQRFAHQDGTYVPLPPIEVEGRKLGMVDAHHTESVFVQHEAEITNQIRASQSPFVVLEYFDDKMQQIAHPVDGSVSDYLQREQPHASHHDYLSNFYGGIGSICAREGKDIVLVNPHSPGSLTDYVDAYLVAGVLPALAISAGIDRFRRKSDEKMSRRDLFRGVKRAAYAVAGYDLASWLGIPQALGSAISKETGDAMGWNLIDWRDCISALGVRKAFELYGSEIPPDAVVPMVQGVQHDRMPTYLTNPGIARAKADWLYSHYELLSGDQSVRRYTYDKAEGKWKEVASVSI